jgi:hypothetical protein
MMVIHCSGAPPHLDMFDYKPELVRRSGQDIPESFIKGKRFAFTSGTPKLLGTPQKFSQRGKCGTWMSDVLPGIASLADDITVIKSMYTEQFNRTRGKCAPSRNGDDFIPHSKLATPARALIAYHWGVARNAASARIWHF